MSNQGKLYREITELVPAAFVEDFPSAVPLSAVTIVAYLNPEDNSEQNLCFWLDQDSGAWTHLGMITATQNDLLQQLSTRASGDGAS